MRTEGGSYDYLLFQNIVLSLSDFIHFPVLPAGYFTNQFLLTTIFLKLLAPPEMILA